MNPQVPNWKFAVRCLTDVDTLHEAFVDFGVLCVRVVQPGIRE